MAEQQPQPGPQQGTSSGPPQSGDDTAAAGLAAVLGGPPGKGPPAASGPAKPPDPTGTPPPAAPGAGAAPPADPTLKAIQGLIEQAVKPYADQLQQLQGSEDQRNARRRAVDARDDFIRDSLPDYPKEIFRQLLPATEDKAVLHKAAQGVLDGLMGWVRNMARGGNFWMDQQGQLQFGKNIGGDASTGISPIQASDQMRRHALLNAASPQQGLAASLNDQPPPHRRDPATY